MYVYFSTLQHGKIRVLSQWAKAQVTLTGLYLLGGELPPNSISFPHPKSFAEKNLKLFQIKIFLTTILRNQWRLLMSRNEISANPEHYIFKLFWGSMSLDSSRKPKNFFSFPPHGSNFPLPKQKNPR